MYPDGSEATFTVEEQLARLPLPNDAVMRTTTLSGEVHLDGRESVIQIDLHSMSSDQEFRDRYVRTRMFGDHQFATFTVPDVGPLPEGLDSGETSTTQINGSLDIRGVTVPMEFEIEPQGRRQRDVHTRTHDVHMAATGHPSPNCFGRCKY